MLLRVVSLLTRSRIPIRAMSTTAPTADIPEKRSPGDSEISNASIDSQPLTTSAAATGSDTKPAGKRQKTSKDRKEHFEKNRTWKAKDWSSGGKKPVRDGPAPERKPKKKAAVLVGFCGTGYQGMQINPTAKSIESELFKAFCKAGAISEDNSDDPKKVSFMRAARTDKGVHAAGNVVSLKFIGEDPDVVSKINSYLPDQIRVWGYVTTMRNFHAKNACDSRVYEYLLPSYTLMQKKSIDPAHFENMEDASFVELPPSTPEEMAEKRAYRITDEKMQHVRDILKEFEGTHNFHNYTIGRFFKEQASNRYIMSFQVGEPQYVNDTEWLSLKIHGQSFMLHQIRKMVGMLILMVRSATPTTLISKTFGPEKLNIPKAPALGLLLERPIFTQYNTRIAALEQSRDPVDFDKYEVCTVPHIINYVPFANMTTADIIVFQPEIQDFKSKFIYSKIHEDEVNESIFDGWLRLIDGYRGPAYGYLNPEGTIPEDTIVSKGQTRIMDNEDIEDAAADDREG